MSLCGTEPCGGLPLIRRLLLWPQGWGGGVCLLSPKLPLPLLPVSTLPSSLESRPVVNTLREERNLEPE